MQVLHQVLSCFSVGDSGVLKEASDLVVGIGDVTSGILLQEIEFANDGAILESVVESWSGEVSLKDPRGLGWCLSLCQSGWESDVVQELIDEQRLGHFDSAVP